MRIPQPGLRNPQTAVGVNGRLRTKLRDEISSRDAGFSATRAPLQSCFSSKFAVPPFKPANSAHTACGFCAFPAACIRGDHVPQRILFGMAAAL
jgi:hypothetical protein